MLETPESLVNANDASAHALGFAPVTTHRRMLTPLHRWEAWKYRGLLFLCVRLRLYGLWVRSQLPNNGSNDDLMR